MGRLTDETISRRDAYFALLATIAELRAASLISTSAACEQSFYYGLISFL